MGDQLIAVLAYVVLAVSRVVRAIADASGAGVKVDGGAVDLGAYALPWRTTHWQQQNAY